MFDKHFFTLSPKFGIINQTWSKTAAIDDNKVENCAKL